MKDRKSLAFIVSRFQIFENEKKFYLYKYYSSVSFCFASLCLTYYKAFSRIKEISIDPSLYTNIIFILLVLFFIFFIFAIALEVYIFFLCLIFYKKYVYINIEVEKKLFLIKIIFLKSFFLFFKKTISFIFIMLFIYKI